MTQTEMNRLVPQKLRELEEAEQIHVLFAVESGSRAWDFASPDSDFDIRFIYIRTENDYLRLKPLRDVLERPVDDVWDLCGWDLKKALQLLHGSNPSLFEWAGSPIVYRTTEAWEKQVRPMLMQYFQPRKVFMHYLSMGKQDQKAHLGKAAIKAKRYFYMLRPLLAAKWVLKTETPPPMRFSELVETELDAELKPIVSALVEQKRQEAKHGVISRIPELDAYILRETEYLQAQPLPEARYVPWEPLDELFCSLLRGAI